MQWARAAYYCLASIYVDVVGAFDAVIRYLVFGDSPSDEQVAHLSSVMNFNPADMHELAEKLKSMSIMAEAGVSPHLEALIAESHADAWYSFQHLDDPICPLLGSKPGDALGDMVFNFRAAKVVKKIEAKCVADDIASHLSPLSSSSQEAFPDCANGGRLRVQDYDFADDSVFFVVEADPSKFIAKTQAVVSNIASGYAAPGLKLNFK